MEEGKRFYKKIDVKSLEAQKSYINKLDMPLIKPTKFVLKALILAGVTGGICSVAYSLFRREVEWMKKTKNEILTNLKYNNVLKESLRINNVKSITDYVNMNDYYTVEAEKGILEERYKLLEHTDGLVLETCCGVFPNAICYRDKTELNNNLTKKNTKIDSIVGVDISEELLEIASTNNNKLNAHFFKMDCTDLEFDNDTFDTVVDTFGLQSCYDPESQLKEMIRVCKPGGKILLLEFGESLWLLDNYKLLRKFIKNPTSYGSILLWNWDNLLMKHKNITILKKKRKLNGRLFYYEIAKNTETMNKDGFVDRI